MLHFPFIPRNVALFLLLVLTVSFLLAPAPAQSETPTSETVRPSETANSSPNALGSCWERFSSEEIRSWDQLAACQDAEWVPVVLPEEARLPISQIHWYRTRFEAPRLSGNQLAFLCFHGIRFDAQIRVNGQNVGGCRGGGEPFEIDVSSIVKDGGSYELLIRVEGVTALVKEMPETLSVKPGHRIMENFSGTVLTPVGSQGFNGCGIWEPIRLEVRDSLQFEDLFIQTSWREKKITVDFEVKNLTDAELTVPAAASVEGTDVTFETQTVTLPAGQTVHFRMERPWLNPRSWCPRDPFLYFLNVKLGDCVTRRERFGFREIWCDGDHFVLNGVPFHALATASHPHTTIVGGDSKGPARDFLTETRKANVNCIRLHANYWPEGWCDAADELGMPLIIETGFFCWVRAYALNDPEFWANYAHHVKALQKKLRNHPSFCFFSLCNEILHCGGEYHCPDVKHRLAEAGRKARAFDASRPISFDGDLDPEGVADVVNPHYPVDFGGIRKGHEDLNWPQDCWWVEKEKFMASYPSDFWKWDRKKPLYVGEFLHIQQFQSVDPYSLLLGDDAYAEGFGKVMAQAKGKAWRMQIPAYRAAGMSGFCPWTLTEFGPAPTMLSDENPRAAAVRDSFEPVSFALEPIPACAKAGTVIPAKFWLLNDSDCARELTLKVTFCGQTQSVTRRLNPAGRETVTVELAVPSANSEQPSSQETQQEIVRMELTHHAVESPEKPDWNPDWNLAGKFLPAGEDRFFLREGKVERAFPIQLEAVPRTEFAFTSSRATNAAFLGDPKIAKRCGAAAISDLSDPRLETDFGILIIGPNELSRLFQPAQTPDGKPVPATVGGTNSVQEQLKAFLAKPFNRVLILAQDSYPEGLFPVLLADVTISDPRNTEWSFWPSVKRPFLFPENSPFEPVSVLGIPARLGGPNGFEYCPVLRHGNLTLCQYPIETSPNLWLPEGLLPALRLEQTAPKVLVHDETGSIQKVFDRLFVPYESLDPQTRKAIPASTPRGALAANAFSSGLATPTTLVFVNSASRPIEPSEGERFLLCGMTPENLTRWQAILPNGFSLQPVSGRIAPARILAPNQRAETSIPFGLADCTASDLTWFKNREGLSHRQQTPLQQTADWAILPLVPDLEHAERFPAMGFQEFQPNHEKGKFSDDHYACGVNVSLTHSLAVEPGDYFLEIEGRGSKLEGVGVIFGVRVNEEFQGSVELDSDFSPELLFIHVEKSADGQNPTLKLSFMNDLWNPVTKEDRNMEFRGARLIPVRKGVDGFAAALSPAAAGLVSENVVVDCVKWFAPDAPTLRADHYVRSILRNAGVLRKLTLGGLRIGAHDFDEYATKNHSFTNGSVPILNFGTNGSLTKRVLFRKNGRCVFTFRSGGTACEGVFPHLNLRLDGKIIGEFQLTQQEAANYVLEPETEIPAGEHSVSLQFTNDLYLPSEEEGVPNQDRNLRIEFLHLTPLESSAD